MREASRISLNLVLLSVEAEGIHRRGLETRGKNYLEDVVEKDPTYYDAYLGLGIYHYLADILPKFVKILSFVLGVEGDRDKGIVELNIAAEKGNRKIEI